MTKPPNAIRSRPPPANRHGDTTQTGASLHLRAIQSLGMYNRDSTRYFCFSTFFSGARCTVSQT